jgi:hypothetical protein
MVEAYVDGVHCHVMPAWVADGGHEPKAVLLVNVAGSDEVSKLDLWIGRVAG